jgi:ATP synthase subunit 6
MHFHTPLEAFKIDDFGIIGNMLCGFVVETSSYSLMLLTFFISLLIVGGFCWNHYLVQSIFFYLMLISYIINQIRSSHLNYVPSAVLLLVFLLFFNLIGLYPYSYTFTASLIVNLFLTFGIVCGLLLLGLSLFSQRFLLSFIPGNVPVVILPLLFVIEVLSFIMRVFSMSIRLFSNMVAGHSLLHLLEEFGKYCLFISKGKTLLIFLSLLILSLGYIWVLFEIFVALLQAYVFVLLYLLYISEIRVG